MHFFVFYWTQTLGTAACPPYHLAIVIGGTSAEFNLKTVKLASTKYLDTLYTTGTESRALLELLVLFIFILFLFYRLFYII